MREYDIKKILTFFVGILCLFLLVVDATAQGTLKTQLNISGTAADSVGNPISGFKSYRVRFYDAAYAGLQIGTDLIGSVTLSAEGVFNIPIDPPAEVATQSDFWYELALDTDDDGLDADDVFAERVPIHGVPFAHNAGLLDGQDSAYYLDAANLTGSVPSARLNLTDSDIPDDITIHLASEALSATQAASATYALLLEGQPGSYYLDSGNLTGTIPSARLSLTDSDVPDGLTLSGGTINNSSIGSATPASGFFTDLITSGTPLFEGGSIILGKAGAANRGQVLLHDATDATDYLVRLLAPASLVSDVTLTLPSADGTSGQMLGTDGAGNLSFSTIEAPFGGTTIAIGDTAAVSYNGVAVGVRANGISYGTSIGYQTNSVSYGTAVGYQSNGYDAGVAIGRRANGYAGSGSNSGSVAIGYTANAYSGDGHYSGGVAVGYLANARHNFNEHAAGAVAIGRRANAFIRGVAIGGSTIRYADFGYEVGDPHYDGYNNHLACGYNEGVAVGYAAGGQNQGVGIGYRANGYYYGTAIGYRANSGNQGRSFAKGSYSRATRYNEEWKGADTIPENEHTFYLSGNNKYGYGQVDFYGMTTTNTLTELFLGGSSNKRFALHNNSAVCFTAYTVAVNKNNGNTSIWQHSGGIKRRSGANTTFIVGSVNALQTSEESGLTYNPSFTADTTNGSLRVRVRGVDSNTVQWNVMLIYSEVRE